MENKDEQIKLIASALYEIRQLLAPYLGSNRDDIDTSIRIATHLSYALHNEALSLKDGQNFNIEDAVKKINAIDNIVDEEFSDYFLDQYMK